MQLKLSIPEVEKPKCFINAKFCQQLIYNYDHSNYNSCQHKRADYWAGDTFGK